MYRTGRRMDNPLTIYVCNYNAYTHKKKDAEWPTPICACVRFCLPVSLCVYTYICIDLHVSVYMIHTRTEPDAKWPTP